MQEITIKTENLSELIGALSIALNGYNSAVGKCFFGLSEQLNPEVYKLLDDKGYKTADEKYEFLKSRGNLLKDMYNQLLEIEKEQDEIPTVSIDYVIKNGCSWTSNYCSKDEYIYYWDGDFESGKQVKVPALEQARYELTQAMNKLNEREYDQ